MYFLADFNTALNKTIKGFTRIINGKAIPVKSHSRKYIMATKQALKDLQLKGAKKGIEGSYLINPKTGYVGDYVKGSSLSVDPFDTMRFKNIPSNELDYVKMGQKAPRSVLHNHPGTTSLSAPDVFYATKRNQTYVINENGSIFRGYKLKDYDMDVHSAQATEIFTEMVQKFPKTKQTELSFLATHLANKKMQKEGLIFYRSNLSKVDKSIVDKYKTFTDYVLEKPLYDKSAPISLMADDVVKGRLEAMEDLSTTNLLKRLQLKNISKKQKRDAIKKYIKEKSISYGSVVENKNNIKNYKTELAKIEKKLNDDSLSEWDKDYLLWDLNHVKEMLNMSEEAYKTHKPRVKKDVKQIVERARRLGYLD